MVMTLAFLWFIRRKYGFHSCESIAWESIGKVGLASDAAGGVGNSALCNVDAGHRAIVFDQFCGVQGIVVREGTHFLIPWLQKPVFLDCRSRPRIAPVITGSKGSQNVNLTPRILSGSCQPASLASSGASGRRKPEAAEDVINQLLEHHHLPAGQSVPLQLPQ
ncbi:Prohibitin [Tupaia chinensis]|uniref:Prohibitin n=1 Tax=Tupaia chinensis TaxID=246437 RepID=L9JE16_TUPCH|nr:Prohibitin [Tupaia chinensis]